MKKTIIPVILVSTTLLSGCFEEKAQQNASVSDFATQVSKEDAVAVVNGTYISRESLETLEKEIAQRSHGQKFPKEQLLEELIQRELLVQDAVHKQLDKTPEFIERMAAVRKSLLSQADLQNFLKSNPVTDEEIKAEYDAKMANAGTEYKARHILVKTEDEARKLIIELDNGADFVELAKTKSTGPSGPQGGDLGWFTADRMVPPFSEAVIALENGHYTKEPVETQFGWHVIIREDSRSQTPPPFEAVKEQIRPMLQRKKIQTMMENLRKQAKVEILTSLSDEKAPQNQGNAGAGQSTPAQKTGQAESETNEKTAKPVDQKVNEAVDQGKRAAGQVVDNVNEAVEQGKKAAAAITDKVNESAKNAVEKVDQAAQETTDKAKSTADSAVKALGDTLSQP